MCNFASSKGTEMCFVKETVHLLVPCGNLKGAAGEFKKALGYQPQLISSPDMVLMLEICGVTQISGTPFRNLRESSRML